MLLIKRIVTGNNMAKNPRMRGRSADLPEAERREVQWVEIDKLRLDPLNPRLPDDMEGASQSQLLSALARDYDLQDLGQSIADHGYFSEEPLVTIKDVGRNRWTVIEGNRRLATLLLLGDPTSAPDNVRQRWIELSQGRRHRVKSVPILEYEERDQITPYLGFRHITGVLQWRPYQKARYIAQLVEESRMNFNQIARTIGSRSPTVREHYIAYTLNRQSSNQFNIDTQYVSFGVLRRSLSDPNIRSFIGLDLDTPESELARPIPRSRAKNVAEFYSWVFGNDDEDAVIKDSRELKKLGEVLASAKGLETLRATRNLDYAFQTSGGEERSLIENLNSASYHLDQALPLAIRHRGRKSVIAAVRRCSETLGEILRHFPEATTTR
jgi:hypothetical protein